MAINSRKKLLDIKKLKERDIEDIFDISHKTAYNWIKYGCPRNTDDSFDLKEVVVWWRNRIESKKDDESKVDLDKKKLVQQIKKLELEIADKEKKTITREKVEDIQRNQAHGLMEFLTNGFKRNSPVICAKLGLSGDKIVKYNEVMDDFIKQATDAFSEGGEDIE